MRTIILPPWESYRGFYGADSTAVIFHTEFWEPQAAQDAADELMRELDNGGQFDPAMRAISSKAWGGF